MGNTIVTANAANLSFGPPHMFSAKQELAIEVAHFNGVQINLQRPQAKASQQRNIFNDPDPDCPVPSEYAHTTSML